MPTYTFQRPEGLLAHYTDAAAAFEHILPEQRLRMSPYHRMRDPIENQDVLPILTFWGDRPEAEAAAFAAMADLKTARDAMRVLALSRDVGDGRLHHPTFDCSWARPRMWEQYGDNHAGVCLLFNRVRFEEVLRESLGGENFDIGEVKYDREAMSASPLQHISDDRIFDPEQRRQAVADHLNRYREDFFFLKSDDFATEAEYRVVINTDEASPGYATDEQGFAYVGYGDALVAVVLGRHFPDWQRIGARRLCDGAGVEMRRMWWELGSPRLRGPGKP